MGLVERQQAILEEFSKINNWEDRYKKIISMGKAMADLPENLRTEESKVKGCQSQVWLHAQLSDQGRIQLQGDSDALLVKGLVALLIYVYNDSTPAEILGNSADFLSKMGFESHLSRSRTNGLFSMVKQIRHFAMAFQVLLQSNFPS